ncbi:MAG: ABC transporter permease [Thermodesulfovibrionales bacterium]
MRFPNRKELQRFIDLIIVLTQKELKVRYKSSVFGYLWSVGHPLAFAVVFWIAFKVVMRFQMENYTLFLISGLFAWQWFANSVAASAMTFLSNASIIKKVSFPKHLLVASSVLQDLLHFLFSIPVILIFLFAYSKAPTLAWLYGIPLLLIIQYVLICGISMAVATLNLFFRDLERIVGILTMLLFYFTPVIYPESMVPEQYRFALDLNFMAPFIIGWRTLIIEGRFLWPTFGRGALYAAVIFCAGFWVYRKLSWKFAEVL